MFSLITSCACVTCSFLEIAFPSYWGDVIFSFYSAEPVKSPGLGFNGVFMLGTGWIHCWLGSHYSCDWRSPLPVVLDHCSLPVDNWHHLPLYWIEPWVLPGSLCGSTLVQVRWQQNVSDTATFKFDLLMRFVIVPLFVQMSNHCTGDRYPEFPVVQHYRPAVLHPRGAGKDVCLPPHLQHLPARVSTRLCGM